MGRNVRRVPPEWEHPVDKNGEFEPLFQDEMPQWSEDEATHYQMYEETTEGTPISPIMETPEALASWLYENEVSWCGSITATYEAWLEVCNGALGGIVSAFKAA